MPDAASAPAHAHPPPAAWVGWVLAAWVPAAGLLALLLAAGAGYRPLAAVALAAALSLVFASASPGVRFFCRVLPLRPHLSQTLGSQLAAAAVAGGLWAGLARVLAASWGWPAPPALTPLVGSAGALLYLLTAAGFYLALAIERAGASERRAGEARLLAREAELRALQAQINPHFLYNSLNSIAALVASDPEGARAMCARLGEFLRAALAHGGASGLVPLRAELALTRAYLAIEQVRFGPRLAVEERIQPPALDAMVPRLLLQPLVENAVVHGVASRLEGGCILIAAAPAGGGLHLRIANPYDPEERRPGAGMGLSHVSRRLHALYGEEAGIAVKADQGEFQVEVRLPARPAAAPEPAA
jgi:two-component system sensor histidine kinase AlgZ